METYGIKIKHIVGYFEELGINIINVNNQDITKKMLEADIFEMQKNAGNFVECGKIKDAGPEYKGLFQRYTSINVLGLTLSNSYKMLCSVTPFTLGRLENTHLNSDEKRMYRMQGWGNFLSKQLKNEEYNNALKLFYTKNEAFAHSEEEFLESSKNRKASNKRTEATK